MNSMTGFGTATGKMSSGSVSVEVRSVNSRFLDANVSLPPQFGSREREVAKAVSKRFGRGKIDVSVRISVSTVKDVDVLSASSYKDAILRLAGKLGLKCPSDETLLSLVLDHEGVIKDIATGEGEWETIRRAIDDALDACGRDRKREGEALKKDLTAKLCALEKCAAAFNEWMPRMEERFRSMVEERFKSLLGEGVDMNRVLQEVAALMVKYTINEEVVRLLSHISAIKNELDAPMPGKRLDFICQEAGREINTIGSKNPFAEISAVVVDAKDALEAIREQARNVE